MINIGLNIELFKLRRTVNFQRYEFNVHQYYPNQYFKNTRTKEVDFTLDIIDLSYSTARTLCAFHLTNRELYFDVIASLLSHLNFIDPTQTNFLLSESRYKRLRDFSKSTRIGEMAQGINALFVGQRLDFPYIIDFDLAMERTSTILNIQTTGKTPDFVVVNRDLVNIGLFESKGTMSGSAGGGSGYLSKAMEQINDVYHPCFNFSLPFYSKFAPNNDVNKTPLPKNRKSSIKTISEIS